jgi:hypothetical protein
MQAQFLHLIFDTWRITEKEFIFSPYQDFKLCLKSLVCFNRPYLGLDIEPF